MSTRPRSFHRRNPCNFIVSHPCIWAAHPLKKLVHVQLKLNHIYSAVSKLCSSPYQYSKPKEDFLSQQQEKIFFPKSLELFMLFQLTLFSRCKNGYGNRRRLYSLYLMAAAHCKNSLAFHLRLSMRKFLPLFSLRASLQNYARRKRSHGAGMVSAAMRRPNQDKPGDKEWLL